jgi:hypothetical protein
MRSGGYEAEGMAGEMGREVSPYPAQLGGRLAGQVMTGIEIVRTESYIHTRITGRREKDGHIGNRWTTSRTSRG